MNLVRWIPQILAIVCGIVVYWKATGSCQWVVDNTYNKLPFVKDQKCADKKYVRWLLMLVGAVCACSCLRLGKRVQEFLTPVQYGDYGNGY